MLNTLWLILTAVIIVTNETRGLYTCTVNFEAENGSGGKQIYRSLASGGITALLKEGEAVSDCLKFHNTNNNNCSFKLLSVRYSNDGIGDVIEVYINDTQLASFQTKAYAANGDDWNYFQTKTGFSTSTQLSTSNMITVAAVEADEYGDNIINIDDTEDNECPRSLISFDNYCELEVVNAYDIEKIDTDNNKVSIDT